jgi:hypothetical protein
VYATHAAQVEARRLTITAAAQNGWGVLANQDAVLSIDRAVISNRIFSNHEEFPNTIGGVLLYDNASVTIGNSVVSYNQSGVFVWSGANLYATDVEIVNNLGTGLWLVNESVIQGEAILENVAVTGNEGRGIDHFRKNLYMTDSIVSSNGENGILMRACLTENWQPVPEGPTLVYIVDTSIEWNNARGLWLADCGTPVMLERVSFVANMRGFPPDLETEAQLDLHDTYFGSVTARSVSFSHPPYGDVYKPPAGTVAVGGDGYRDPETGYLHYYVGHEDASITFAD